MNKSTKSLVKKYYNRVFKSKIPIESMYIFGSAVTGSMRSASDIDICIVSPTFGKDRIKERVRLMKLRDGISDAIEPHPYSPTDFYSKYDSLAREIKKTGIKFDNSS